MNTACYKCLSIYQQYVFRMTIGVMKDVNEGRQNINQIISKTIHPKDIVIFLPIKFTMQVQCCMLKGSILPLYSLVFEHGLLSIGPCVNTHITHRCIVVTFKFRCSRYLHFQVQFAQPPISVHARRLPYILIKIALLT